MNSIAVSINNVSKKYRLFNSPKERFLEAIHPFNKKYHREFWALREINFDIHKGETVGIIGKNGSGKSTLLQIICSVLRPTSGTTKINGKISALLELGAGFNPEFTGRSNVLMNGAMMGFSAEEMKQRMPTIEAFADIGEFIDQPVKIYSSGMLVRLAFAAAINVDPDILIVDEALAVGDIKFQQKCFQKFRQFQDSGKTIIFVTHDTSVIVKHCDSAILIHDGTVLKMGRPNNIVNCYYELLYTGKLPSGEPGQTVDDSAETRIIDKKEEVKESPSQIELKKFLNEILDGDNCPNRRSYNYNEHRFGDKRAQLIDYMIICDEQIDPVAVRCGATVGIYLKARFNQYVKTPLFGFSIKTVDGVVVYASNTRCERIVIEPAKEADIVVFKFSIKMPLHPGDYFIDLGVAEKLFEKDEPVDIRYVLVHLSVTSNSRLFDGLVELESDCREVMRNNCKAML